MTKRQCFVLITAFSFVLFLSVPAFASKGKDSKDQPSPSKPMVQTTGSSGEHKGESVKKEGMRDNRADFKKETPKGDPVVRNDGHKVLQPNQGESIKREGMRDHQADFNKETPKEDPVVRNDGHKAPQPNKGESIKSEGMRDHQADFKKETPKEDPVVRNDGHKVPQPNAGEDVKNDKSIETGR